MSQSPATAVPARAVNLEPSRVQPWLPLAEAAATTAGGDSPAAPPDKTRNANAHATCQIRLRRRMRWLRRWLVIATSEDVIGVFGAGIAVVAVVGGQR